MEVFRHSTVVKKSAQYTIPVTMQTTLSCTQKSTDEEKLLNATMALGKNTQSTVQVREMLTN